MTQHTPGPWELVGSPEENYVGRIVADGRRLTICEMPTGWAQHAEKERQSNAHLLAAAPELLEAAQEAMQTLTRLRQRGTIGDSPSIRLLGAAIVFAKEGKRY